MLPQRPRPSRTGPAPHRTPPQRTVSSRPPKFLSGAPRVPQRCGFCGTGLPAPPVIRPRVCAGGSAVSRCRCGAGAGSRGREAAAGSGGCPVPGAVPGAARGATRPRFLRLRDARRPPPPPPLRMREPPGMRDAPRLSGLPALSAPHPRAFAAGGALGVPALRGGRGFPIPAAAAAVR